MSTNEADSILPTTGHTRYQSIGPTEPEEVSCETFKHLVFFRNELFFLQFTIDRSCKT
jgi:hypothetical protein